MVNNDIIETDELNKKAEEVQKPENAAPVIKQYENIIRTKKKWIYIYGVSPRKSVQKVQGQGKVHQTSKWFKGTQKHYNI